jgi:hypothetical protein
MNSDSVEEISLHNDFILDLGEPYFLIMIVIFEFYFIIGSKNFSKKKILIYYNI